MCKFSDSQRPVSISGTIEDPSVVPVALYRDGRPDQAAREQRVDALGARHDRPMEMKTFPPRTAGQTTTRTIVYSGNLPRYIFKYRQLYSQRKLGIPGDRLETVRIGELLSAAAVTCSHLDRTSAAFPPPAPEILLSIKVLIQTISLELYKFHSDEVHRPALHRSPLSILPVWDHMRQQRAWCPHHISYLSSVCTYNTMIYLASLRRKVPVWLDHTPCEAEDHCVAYNTNSKSVVVKHVQTGCRCELVHAPHSDLLSILQGGEIPVVDCVRDRHGKFTLSYSKLAPGTRYAAISVGKTKDRTLHETICAYTLPF